jgi:hypothetical protein
MNQTTKRMVEAIAELSFKSAAVEAKDAEHYANAAYAVAKALDIVDCKAYETGGKTKGG